MAEVCIKIRRFPVLDMDLAVEGDIAYCLQVTDNLVVGTAGECAAWLCLWIVGVAQWDVVAVVIGANHAAQCEERLLVVGFDIALRQIVCTLEEPFVLYV